MGIQRRLTAATPSVQVMQLLLGSGGLHLRSVQTKQVPQFLHSFMWIQVTSGIFCPKRDSYNIHAVTVCLVHAMGKQRRLAIQASEPAINRRPNSSPLLML